MHNSLSHHATIVCLVAALSFFAAVPSRSQDTTPPTVLSATCTPGSRDVFVTFSEPMEIFGALDPFNYVLLTQGFRGEAESVAQANPLGTVFRVDYLTLITTESRLMVDNASDLAGNALWPSPTTLLIQPVPEPGVFTFAGLAAILFFVFAGRQRRRTQTCSK